MSIFSNEKLLFIVEKQFEHDFEVLLQLDKFDDVELVVDTVFTFYDARSATSLTQTNMLDFKGSSI